MLSNYVFLHTAYKVRLIKKCIQLHFTQAKNCLVNPTCSIENDVKDFWLISFFLNELLKMSKFKYFVLQNKFLKCSLNLEMLSIIEKF